MSLDRRVIALVAGAAVLLGACGGSASSPAAGTPPAASEAAAVSEAPAETQEAVSQAASPEPSDNAPEVSFAAGAAGDLESTLPDKVGDTQMSKTSFDGSNIGLAGMAVDAGELTPILEANGKTVNDVRAAIASPKNPTPTSTATVMAMQVRGLDAKKLLPLFTSGSDFKDGNLAGKSVLTASEGGFSSVIYTKDDVVYLVFLASDDAAKEIVGSLP